ncbi:alpha/beta fold hydrolase [Micromonospora ureilytica]|uniref:alpha/beta fold hydrolase n=1 Tax=Micromonospora ureilytica TaxID=709868 RepID=UPI00403A48A5
MCRMPSCVATVNARSRKRRITADHEPYSMRAIARDQIEVMRSLGHEQFRLVGHDRGARCAYRLALDAPDVVTRLAVMDVVPIGDVYNRADKTFSLSYWVWSFLAAPAPVPEQFIKAALFLWSQRGQVAKLYDDPLAIWREWADDVRGEPVGVGHFIPEEAPDETTRQLLAFLS